MGIFGPSHVQHVDGFTLTFMNCRMQEHVAHGGQITARIGRRTGNQVKIIFKPLKHEIDVEMVDGAHLRGSSWGRQRFVFTPGHHFSEIDTKKGLKITSHDGYVFVVHKL